MASRTNTERILEIAEKQAVFSAGLETLKQLNKQDVEERNQLTRRVDDEFKLIAQRLAVCEEKINHLEKLSDRSWQLAPLVISSVAIIVSLIVAVLKK